jgi:hypothetical protein
VTKRHIGGSARVISRLGRSLSVISLRLRDLYGNPSSPLSALRDQHEADELDLDLLVVEPGGERLAADITT